MLSFTDVVYFTGVFVYYQIRSVFVFNLPHVNKKDLVSKKTCKVGIISNTFLHASHACGSNRGHVHANSHLPVVGIGCFSY